MNNQLNHKINDQRKLIDQLDIFSSADNIESYKQLMGYVREVLREHGQEDLLTQIINQPLKVDQSAVNIEDESELYHENSVKLVRDLESLMPLIGKAMLMLRYEGEHMKQEMVEQQRDLEAVRAERQADLAQIVQRQEEERMALKRVED